MQNVNRFVVEDHNQYQYDMSDETGVCGLAREIMLACPKLYRVAVCAKVGVRRAKILTRSEPAKAIREEPGR